MNPRMANLFSMTSVLVAGQKMGCEEADAMDVSVAAAQVRWRSVFLSGSSGFCRVFEVHCAGIDE